eukprot:TRINITY_DN1554_c0_g2_i6.p1 TRINITY_DN1554_c0_g2~~TRINITY_DN1554_c0_g2_i6.p1  ORF type:complete len:150 (+),score=9.67 TRINITY_DN1554_c0_g2_i6:52-450(+)
MSHYSNYSSESVSLRGEASGPPASLPDDSRASRLDSAGGLGMTTVTTTYSTYSTRNIAPIQISILPCTLKSIMNPSTNSTNSTSFTKHAGGIYRVWEESTLMLPDLVPWMVTTEVITMFIPTAAPISDPIER